MIELWGIRTTLLLSSLPGSFRPGVVAPDRALSIVQIELNCLIIRNITVTCIKKRCGKI